MYRTFHSLWQLQLICILRCFVSYTFQIQWEKKNKHNVWKRAVQVTIYSRNESCLLSAVYLPDSRPGTLCVFLFISSSPKSQTPMYLDGSFSFQKFSGLELLDYVFYHTGQASGFQHLGTLISNNGVNDALIPRVSNYVSTLTH